MYADLDPRARKDLWAHLTDIAGNIKNPWLLAGDFHETFSSTKQNHKCGDMARRCAKFNCWIENN